MLHERKGSQVRWTTERKGQAWWMEEKGVKVVGQRKKGDGKWEIKVQY